MAEKELFGNAEQLDTISRQAALDAMDTWDKFGCDPDGKLVRYDDDKHYIPYVHYEDMVHAIKHLPSAQRWIPCSERLPEVGRSVLLSVGSMYTAEGCLRDDGDWAQFRWTATLRKDRVDAWCPLPEPWKGERDG